MMYTINTECGLMKDFEAESIEAAKQIYSERFGFDFDDCDEVAGSWYWITEDGVRVEDCTEAMPN